MTFARVRVLSCLLMLGIALPAAAVEPAQRDGQHDFDFAHGKWKIRVKKLKAPLKGSKEWIEFSGTSTCRPFVGRSPAARWFSESKELELGYPA